jgi:uncharacterized protein YceH (UPF0502 family)
VDADSVELRVLGCLIEKQQTTPDVYPLSLNSLRLACNQTSNRDPVVEYDEPMIRAALDRLAARGWARLASGPGSRAAKYRHLLPEALEISDRELAVLCVLMLRGPQTPGELKGRTERLQPFASLVDVHETLDGLIQRELVARLTRRPGQKEQRYAQLLGADQVDAERAERATTGRSDDLETRLSRLEDEVASLRQAVESLTGAYAPRAEEAPASSGSGVITAGTDASSTGSSNENVEPEP